MRNVRNALKVPYVRIYTSSCVRCDLKSLLSHRDCVKYDEMFTRAWPRNIIYRYQYRTREEEEENAFCGLFNRWIHEIFLNESENAHHWTELFF